MPFSSTGKAIGAVTELLHDQLQNSLIGFNLNVSVGRIELSTTGNPPTNPRLNLFLFEIHFDEYMKNTPIYEGQQPPIWLVLRYLLTAFDKDGESDSVDAHEFLGEGIKLIQNLNFKSLGNFANPALSNNPEELKVTFIESSYEFLSKIMQGSDEKYRLSVGFEIRPIMIASNQPPDYSPLVGIDYTKSPSNIIDKNGINIEISSFFGPTIMSISPTKFEVDSSFIIFGNNLVSDIVVTIGSIELQIISQRSNKIECLISQDIDKDGLIAAGSQPIRVIQNLKNGKKRSSNILVADLLPTLTTAQIVESSISTVDDPQTGIRKLYANIELNGVLLGRKKYR